MSKCGRGQGLKSVSYELEQTTSNLWRGSLLPLGREAAPFFVY
jgi:hypothetical protein